jgi:hypothetical protein
MKAKPFVFVVVVYVAAIFTSPLATAQQMNPPFVYDQTVEGDANSSGQWFDIFNVCWGTIGSTHVGCTYYPVDVGGVYEGEVVLTVDGSDATFPSFSYHTLSTISIATYTSSIQITNLVVVQAPGYSDTLATNLLVLFGPYTPNGYPPGTPDYYLAIASISPFTNTFSDTVRGHVYSACNGSPIPGASVVLGGYFQATTDSNGNYSISNVPPVTYSGVVSAGNYLTLTNTVTIPSGVSVVTNNFSLSPPASVTGYVSCSCGGSPIVGATVTVGTNSTTSGSNGVYSISGIAPGTYMATVTASNYVSITNSVIISSGCSTTTQNFTLSRSSPALDYFGVGVNWLNVTTPPDMSGVRGDLDATDLYGHLQTDLSSIFNQMTSAIVPLDATQSSVNNLSTISSEFTQFMNSICPNDTVVYYASSHGGVVEENNIPTFAIGVSADFATGNNLDAVFIANLLNMLPNSTRKIVILYACQSAGLAPYLSTSVKNISILASAAAYPFTFNGVTYDITTTSAESDGTGVFTDTLDAELDQHVFNLSQLMVDILLDSKQVYANLVGQNLNLKNSGSAIFTGLNPQLWEGSGFTGDLASNVVSGLPPLPIVSTATMSNGFFKLSLSNVSTQGHIALEYSTNLLSWLQISFNPAAGTNLIYSIPTANQASGFFRAKVAP